MKAIKILHNTLQVDQGRSTNLNKMFTYYYINMCIVIAKQFLEIKLFIMFRTFIYEVKSNLIYYGHKSFNKQLY